MNFHFFPSLGNRLYGLTFDMDQALATSLENFSRQSPRPTREAADITLWKDAMETMWAWKYRRIVVNSYGGYIT